MASTNVLTKRPEAYFLLARYAEKMSGGKIVILPPNCV